MDKSQLNKIHLVFLILYNNLYYGIDNNMIVILIMTCTNISLVTLFYFNSFMNRTMKLIDIRFTKNTKIVNHLKNVFLELNPKCMESNLITFVLKLVIIF
jgi:hypothetical protein